MKRKSVSSTVTPDPRPRSQRLLCAKLIIPPHVSATGEGDGEKEEVACSIETQFSPASCYILPDGNAFTLEIRITAYTSVQSALMSLESALCSVYCKFSGGSSVADEKDIVVESKGKDIFIDKKVKFLDQLHRTDTVALCTVCIMPLTSTTSITSKAVTVSSSSPKGSVCQNFINTGNSQYTAILHPSGKSSALLLITSPTESRSSLLACPSCRNNLLTPTVDSSVSSLSDAVTGSSDVHLLPPPPSAPTLTSTLSSTSLRQKNLRRRMSIKGGASSSLLNVSGGGVSGIAHSSSGTSSSSSSGGGNSTSNASPTSWIKENVTSIGNSPLTSPMRESSVSDKAAGNHRPYFSSLSTLGKITSCTGFITSAPTNSNDISCNNINSSAPEGMMYSDSSMFVNGTSNHHSTDGDGYIYSSNILSSLSPSGDSGSRSIFPELVLEGGLCVALGGDEGQQEQGGGATLLDYSNIEDEREQVNIVHNVTDSRVNTENKSKYSDGNEESSVVNPVAGGLFSSVMRGVRAAAAAISTKCDNSEARLLLRSSSDHDSSLLTTSDVSSGTSTSLQDIASVMVTSIPSDTTKPATTGAVETGVLYFQEVHGKEMGSNQTIFKNKSLLEYVVQCIFLREISPLTAAKAIINKIYRNHYIKESKKREEKTQVTSKLKKNNNTVASLAKILLLEVNLIVTDNDNNVNQWKVDKVFSKSVACLLFIFILLENELRVQKIFKKYPSFACKPPRRSIVKCLGKLKSFFQLKKYSSNFTTGHSNAQSSSSSRDKLVTLSTAANNVIVSGSNAGEQYCISTADMNWMLTEGSASTNGSNSGTCTDDNSSSTQYQLSGQRYDGLSRLVSVVLSHYSTSAFLEDFTATQLILNSPDDESRSEKVVPEKVTAAPMVVDISKGYRSFFQANALRNKITPIANSKSAESACNDVAAPLSLEVAQQDCLLIPENSTFPLTQNASVADNKQSEEKNASKSTIPPGALKKKNSLITVRAPLNGHRTSMEGILKNQQHVTSSAPSSTHTNRGSNSSERFLNSKVAMSRDGTEGINNANSKKRRHPVPLFQNSSAAVTSGSYESKRSKTAVASGLHQRQLFKSVPMIGTEDLSNSNQRRFELDLDEQQRFDSSHPYQYNSFEKVVQDTPMRGMGVIQSTPLPEHRIGIRKSNRSTTTAASSSRSSVVDNTPARKKRVISHATNEIPNTPM